MENRETVLISACLAGVKCRYNGTDTFNEIILTELKDKTCIICCPELLAGQPIPRPACNICGGDGFDVLKNKAKVIGIDDNDYTDEFIAGAKSALELALRHGVKKAYLQKNSPSCGFGTIYDENGKDIIEGNGVFTALLIQNGIEIVSL